jgi:SLT domain-containing protein
MKRPILTLLLVALLAVAVASVPAIASPDQYHCLMAATAIAAPSYTLNEWLALRKYSRAEWYRMKARGDGPLTIGEGRRQRITPNEDARWLREQERKAKAETSWRHEHRAGADHAA